MFAKKSTIQLTLAFLIAGLVAAGSAWGYNKAFKQLIKRDGVYTLTNLHPDPNARRLYAVNYQQAGLIPVCSEVTLIAVNKKQLKFKVKDTGIQYVYIYHKAAAEHLWDHLGKYFGTECPKDKIAGMSAIDQKGIAQGKALDGMTKEGVILAIGYPPKHVNPNPMQMDAWTYWSNRFNRFRVEFNDKGVVVAVVE